jgi:cell division septation protein DedD
MRKRLSPPSITVPPAPKGSMRNCTFGTRLLAAAIIAAPLVLCVNVVELSADQPLHNLSLAMNSDAATVSRVHDATTRHSAPSSPSKVVKRQRPGTSGSAASGESTDPTPAPAPQKPATTGKEPVAAWWSWTGPAPFRHSPLQTLISHADPLWGIQQARELGPCCRSGMPLASDSAGRWT